MPLPDFLIIGAQKGGTSWLHHNLSAHPEIYMPPTKELHFFDREHIFERGFQWYMAQFDAPRNVKSRGEATPAYLDVDSVPARIHAALPDAKLIAILRNPIDRAYSHYRMQLANGWLACDFETALECDPHILKKGMYGTLLMRYLEYYERSRFLILRYEDIQNPAELLQECYQFLDVSPDFTPSNIESKVHRTKAIRHVWLNSLVLGIGRGLRKAGMGNIIKMGNRMGIRKILRRYNTTDAAQPETMSESTRQQLREYYLPEIEKVERAFDLDLSVWK